MHTVEELHVLLVCRHKLLLQLLNIDDQSTKGTSENNIKHP